MTLRKFSLHLAPHEAELSIDGVAQDLKGVRRISVDYSNEVPTLYVETIGTGVLVGEGIIRERVVPLMEEEETDAMLRFLGNIDPAEFEQEILNNFGVLGDTTGQVALALLQRWIRGD